MKRLSKMAIAVVLVFVVMTALLIFFLRPRGALPALPNPNGYGDLVKAGTLINGNLNDIKTLDIDALRGLVDANGEALRLLRVGLGRSCAVDTEAAVNNNMATMTADMSALKKTALLLTAEGRLRELENRPGEAARSYLDAIYMGCKASKGGFVINRLVGVACEAIGTAPLVKIVPQLTEDQLKPLLSKVAEIETNYISWDEVIANEKHYAYRQILKTPGSILALPMAQASVKTAQQKHDLAAAHFRLLAMEVALRCYQFEQHKVAQKPDELVPKYLQAILKDPFSERAMIFKPGATNWVVYSYGTNRVDNGGLRGADLFFDSGW